MIEAERMSFNCKKQKDLKSESYSKLATLVENPKSGVQLRGIKVVLSSSFTGSPRTLIVLSMQGFTKYTRSMDGHTQTGSAPLLFFNNNFVKLSGFTAWELLEKYNMDPDEYWPEVLDDILGKECLFKIFYSEYNVSNKNHTYRCDAFSKDTELIKHYKKNCSETDFEDEETTDDFEESNTVAKNKSNNDNNVDNEIDVFKNLIVNEKLSVCGILETRLKGDKVRSAGDKVFGRWNWCHNAHASLKEHKDIGEEFLRIVYNALECDRMYAAWAFFYTGLRAVLRSRLLDVTLQIRLTQEYGTKPKPFRFANYTADKEEFGGLFPYDSEEAERTEAGIEVICGEYNSSFTQVKDQEVLEMIKEVTNDEIKAAIFDIEDNKAPGSDGFTAKFLLRRHGHVVGFDVFVRTARHGLWLVFLHHPTQSAILMVKAHGLFYGEWERTEGSVTHSLPTFITLVL
ncbi:replication protein A 70 kDa DNA-binding subunit B [Tanacetum coccineum]